MTTDARLHRIVAAQPYPLVFATISGAHRCGFPSPDLEIDLRGAQVLLLAKVVGFEVREEAVGRPKELLDLPSVSTTLPP